MTSPYPSASSQPASPSVRRSRVTPSQQWCSWAVLGCYCVHRGFMAYRTSLLAGRRAVRAAIPPDFGLCPMCKHQQHAPVVGDLVKHGLSSSSKAAGVADVYAVKKLPTPTLSVFGSDKRFPVRRVYCVGSNYRCALPAEQGSRCGFVVCLGKLSRPAPTMLIAQRGVRA